jgi:TRAP-type C4-dicarboxylate transport system permease small subunit
MVRHPIPDGRHDLEDQSKLTAILTRDPFVTIMFGIAIMLIVVNLSFAAIEVRTHHIEILKIPMLATGAFAIAGIVLGFVRSLRNSGRNRIA